MLESQQNKTAVAKRMDLGLYFKQQPVMLALLAVLGVIFFWPLPGCRAHIMRSGTLWGTGGSAAGWRT
jgi:hypothetical protein